MQGSWDSAWEGVCLWRQGPPLVARPTAENMLGGQQLSMVVEEYVGIRARALVARASRMLAGRLVWHPPLMCPDGGLWPLQLSITVFLNIEYLELYMTRLSIAESAGDPSPRARIGPPRRYDITRVARQLANRRLVHILQPDGTSMRLRFVP